MPDSYEHLKAHFDRIAEANREARHAREKRLETALRDLLAVISADDLIPESVSYMRQARAVLAENLSPPDAL